MKLVLCIMALHGLIALTFALPLDDAAKAHIIRYDYEVDIDKYDFSFESSDGIDRKESGELKDIGGAQKALTVDGYVLWTAPDGQRYRLDYFANEKGFQPSGDHLPNLSPKSTY